MFMLFVSLFLKGPVWLRVIAWTVLGAVVLLALLLVFTRPDSSSTERLHLDHVNSTHHATQPVRR